MTFTGLSVGLWATILGSLVAAVTLMYLMRMRRRRVEVPFAPLWQKLIEERQSSRLFRVLKRFFSLLVQCVVVALLVTAFANPEWTGDWSLETETEKTNTEGRHLLLVVDVSASMGAMDVPGGRFERGRKEALRVLEDWRPGDRVRLATFSRETVARTDWTQDPNIIRRALETLAPEDTGTDRDGLIHFTRAAIRELDNAQVVIVTDRAFTPLDEDLIRALKMTVVDVGVEDSTNNVAILDFKVRPHLGNRLQHALYYKLKNYSTRPVDLAVYVREDLSGHARNRRDFQAQQVVSAPTHHRLDPGEERVFERSVSDLTATRVALEIKPQSGTDFIDLFELDDMAFATVTQRKKVRVQLVGRPNLFLQAALETSNNVEVVTVTPEAYAGGDGFDLTVFDSALPPIPTSGNAVYVNVEDGAVPYRSAGPVSGGSLRVPGAVQNHPLMRFVKFVDLEAERVQRIRPRKGERIMARDRRGHPVIVAHSAKDARWIAIGFDPVATEWVGHYSFSIFFANAINWFFAEDVRMQPVQSLASHWSVTLPWAATVPVRVSTPQRENLRALVDARNTLAYTGRQAGYYRVTSETQPEQTMIVAASLADSRESQLSAMGDYPRWEARESLDPPSSSTLASASLWKIFVLLAMLILLFEWFTYHRRWTA